MDPKEIRNTMISLAILAAGIWFVINITKSYMTITTLPGIPEGLSNSLDSLGMLLLYAIGVIEVLLLLAWLFARRGRSSAGKGNTPPLQSGNPQGPQQF
ncbi:MAG: hypothetical protein HY364_05500 [Candidatus Aenigmarchaeota archaeon]|nr:hypothetical protein [Candidatus Aenigmarchaeota archaeon]